MLAYLGTKQLKERSVKKTKLSTGRGCLAAASLSDTRFLIGLKKNSRGL